jgi:UDP-N-acetylmuramoyl-L-alanyl-D-glutamate--2,6-diaminopimelate ligase
VRTKQRESLVPTREKTPTDRIGTQAVPLLSELLEGIPACGPAGLSTPVMGVAYASRSVEAGDAFFCIPGFRHDGHEFAAEAVSRGAAVVVATREVPGLSVPVVLVDDTRAALAIASARLFSEPSLRLEVAGITGTNGKTTTTYILDSILKAAGRVTGLIGTIETRIGEERRPASHTTPESRDLQELLARMADAGVSAVSMEVSSHAIDLHRVDGMHFAVAAFTNLSQDHLDYHATLEEYFSVKARLMETVAAERRVVDVDDPHGRRLAGQVPVVWTVGMSPDAVVRAEGVALEPGGTVFDLVTPAGSVRVTLPLVGEFNVGNALVASGCALALGIDLPTVARGLACAPQVPGRLERIEAGQDFAVLVDYAHTPDGLAKAISAVRAVTPGRVITVFGCGGDRDPDKRPLMGRAAGELSDVAVLTSDNPRTEDPVGIILQVRDGLEPTASEHHVEVDRRAAIALALRLAQVGDAVMIAGKGHEDYQIFSDRTVHFDDREVAREELAKLW